MKSYSLHERLTYLFRVFWIDQQLRANQYPNARLIAEKFEVSTKTGQRTLDFMRDQLRLPLAYCAEHRGWYYSEPAFALPLLQMTEGELVALLLAERMANAYRGTAIGHQVEQAFAKIVNSMTDVVSIDLNALSEAYSFEAAVTSEIDRQTFLQLGQAIRNHIRLEMIYYTASRGELSERQVDPLHLRNYLGEWYLIAFDHLRNETRSFHVGRIRELRLTDKHFEPPAGFHLQEYLDSGFAMIRGLEPIEVELIFNEYQARWIRERSKAHKTEEREELPDGRLRVRMQVTGLDGVKRYAMQYGANVQVIKPAELRQAVRQELAAMNALYENE
jgi:predicted DNA-binding transcriptional regulator YafY